MVMIHTGSRGLGHQVCTDYLEVAGRALRRYDISVPDRQLACAPANSAEARDYLGAMRAAANFAFANRQLLTHWARDVFARELGADARELAVVYDVAHNIAKVEEHVVDGAVRRLIVHRKGARSEEHTSELQSPCNLVCRLLLEKKKQETLLPTHTTRARTGRRLK